MVWSVIGWVLLGLLGLLVLVLAVPSTVYLKLENGAFTVKVRVLFVKLAVLPMKPRRAKKEKPKRERKARAAKEPREKPQKKKKTLGDMVRLGKRLAGAGLAALRVVLRHLRVRDVRLVVPVHAGEAAATALRCGELQMVIGALRALLDGRIKIRYRQLVLVPDFTGRQGGRLYFSCKAVFSLGIMLVAGVVFLLRFLASRRPAYTRADYLRAARRRTGQAAQDGGQQQGKAG